MAEIIRNPEYEKLVSSVYELENELAKLVHERDELLFHVCPKIQTEYMLKIGKIESAIFDYQCMILRIKREIELIQAFSNRGEPYTIIEIEKQLDREYQDYTNKLLDKQKEIDNARAYAGAKGRLLTEEETTELKRLYTQIVKKLHPDINPDSTEEQHAQFVDAVNAYQNADLSEMRIIFLLMEKTAGTSLDSKNTMNELCARKEKLFQEKDYLLKTIEKIKQTFPYTAKELLQNDANLREKIDELAAILSDCKEKHSDIEGRLKAMTGQKHE
jgi:hypothetical protein